MLLRFPTFSGRVENKKGYGSLRVSNIVKTVLQIMVEVLGIYKKNLRCDRLFPHNLVFLFQVKNGLHEKMKTSNISGAVQPISFIFTLCMNK